MPTLLPKLFNNINSFYNHRIDTKFIYFEILNDIRNNSYPHEKEIWFTYNANNWNPITNAIATIPEGKTNTIPINPQNGDNITISISTYIPQYNETFIDDYIYTFVEDLSINHLPDNPLNPIIGEIAIGTTLSITIDNLIDAINYNSFNDGVTFNYAIGEHSNPFFLAKKENNKVFLIKKIISNVLLNYISTDSETIYWSNSGTSSFGSYGSVKATDSNNHPLIGDIESEQKLYTYTNRPILYHTLLGVDTDESKSYIENFLYISSNITMNIESEGYVLFYASDRFINLYLDRRERTKLYTRKPGSSIRGFDPNG